MENTNKVAFITGGSRGIGKAIAKKFAENGYDLAINYVSNNTDLEGLKKDLSVNGNQVELFQGSVDNFEAVEKMVNDIIEKFGKIDCLVNNAGITKDNLLMRMSAEDFERVIAINLTGTFNVTKCVAKYMMKARCGSIVNISSVVGVSGNAGQANYSASKAGIIGFTKSIAKELASRNIIANAIAPGFIETDMTDVLKEEIKDEISKTIPLKRMGTSEEIANAVYFLGNDNNKYITGQVLNVDGGMLM